MAAAAVLAPVPIIDLTGDSRTDVIRKNISRGKVDKGAVKAPVKKMPSMLDVIKECIVEHPWESQGVSRPIIKKYIANAYGVNVDASMAKDIGAALRIGLAKGMFELPNGLNGKVKLSLVGRKPTAEAVPNERAPLGAKVDPQNIVSNKLENIKGKMVAKAVPVKASPKFESPVKRSPKNKENINPVVAKIALEIAVKMSPARPLQLKNQPLVENNAIKVEVKPALKATPKQHIVNAKSPAKGKGPRKSLGKPIAKKAFKSKELTVSIVPRRNPKVDPPLLYGGVTLGSGDNRWTLAYKMGAGAFGDVWLANGIGKNVGQRLAVKVEWRKADLPLLNMEERVYNSVKGSKGFPSMQFYVTQGDYIFLGMEMLGASLEAMLNQYNRQLPMSTVLNWSVQMLQRLEEMHNKGWLHRDFKPDNSLRGATDPNLYYLVDFGFSKRYCNPGTGDHLPPKTGKGCLGTPRYASLNVHQGREPSRRDDLESLAYCMIYLVKGRLPWQGLSDQCDIWQETYRIKSTININELCMWVPPEFGAFLRYCRNLAFAEKPDYKRWRDVFREVHKRMFPPKVYNWAAPQAQPQKCTCPECRM